MAATHRPFSSVTWASAGSHETGAARLSVCISLYTSPVAAQEILIALPEVEISGTGTEATGKQGPNSEVFPVLYASLWL